MSAEYKCRNCRHREELDHSGMDNPMCPDCRVEQMTEMQFSECSACGGREFRVLQRAQGESITGAEPTAICTDCGRTGEIDDDGVWW